MCSGQYRPPRTDSRPRVQPPARDVRHAAKRAPRAVAYRTRRMATEAARGAAPLSYLGGRSFVDDRTLLLELFTAVLAASEGDDAVTLHERAAALGKRSRAGDHAATRALEELVAGARRSTTPRCSCARSRAGSSSSTSPRTTSASAACAAASARAPAPPRAARCATPSAPGRARHDRRRAARRCSPAPSCGSS